MVMRSNPVQTLRQAWRTWREQRALRRRPIPDALWRRTLKRFPFLPSSGPDEVELRRLCSLFLDSKEFTGAQGLVVRDDMALAIAAQACLPILRLGLSTYNSFVGIVVHPGQVRAQRQAMDDDGVVHEYEEVLSGEAVEGGPVTLSWRDVRGAGATARDGYNVVIHEFAHVLDMTNGRLDATPALPTSIDATAWAHTWHQAHERFAQEVDHGATTALDPYGAQSPEEFFAVMVEAFFVAPQTLAHAQPVLFDLLRRYFRQDPLPR
ncbi:MAG: hypothetical protein RI949_873 [Pseudomonadota bacterium]|jgi:Mlc titration factor MtfA (ptsG expression regulator)